MKGDTAASLQIILENFCCMCTIIGVTSFVSLGKVDEDVTLSRMVLFPCNICRVTFRVPK